MLNAEQDDTQKPIDKMKSFLEKEEQVRDKPWCGSLPSARPGDWWYPCGTFGECPRRSCVCLEPRSGSSAQWGTVHGCYIAIHSHADLCSWRPPGAWWCPVWIVGGAVTNKTGKNKSLEQFKLYFKPCLNVCIWDRAACNTICVGLLSLNLRKFWEN